jgi:hypothetical protein
MTRRIYSGVCRSNRPENVFTLRGSGLEMSKTVKDPSENAAAYGRGENQYTQK